MSSEDDQNGTILSNWWDEYYQRMESHLSADDQPTRKLKGAAMRTAARAGYVAIIDLFLALFASIGGKVLELPILGQPTGFWVVFISAYPFIFATAYTEWLPNGSGGGEEGE